MPAMGRKKTGGPHVPAKRFAIRLQKTQGNIQIHSRVKKEQNRCRHDKILQKTMNVTLPHLPKRTKRPRKDGVTMVMDKGLSLRQAEEMVESSGEFIDFVKLGF